MSILVKQPFGWIQRQFDILSSKEDFCLFLKQWKLFTIIEDGQNILKLNNCVSWSFLLISEWRRAPSDYYVQGIVIMLCIYWEIFIIDECMEEGKVQSRLKYEKWYLCWTKEPSVIVSSNAWWSDVFSYK